MDLQCLAVHLFQCCSTDEERGCEDGEVRLTAGVGVSDGFVEVCVDRTWVGVCRDGFHLDNARDICDQLTFYPQGIHTTLQGHPSVLAFNP